MAFIRNVSKIWHIDYSVVNKDGIKDRYKFYTHREAVEIPDNLVKSDFIQFHLSQGNLVLDKYKVKKSMPVKQKNESPYV